MPKEIKEKCCNFLFKKYVKCDETKFSKELYLTKKEIKEMIKNGMFFGGHGYRHIRLGELDYSNQKKEIDKMVKFLKTCDIKKTGLCVILMVHIIKIRCQYSQRKNV